MSTFVFQINLFKDAEGLHGFGPLGYINTNAGTTLTTFISGTVGLLTGIASIWFIYLFITGAITFMNAGNDKAAVESAKKRITNGFIGLMLVVVAIFLVELVGRLLGLNNILNPEILIELIAL